MEEPNCKSTVYGHVIAGEDSELKMYLLIREGFFKKGRELCLIYLKKTSDKMSLCEASIFSGLDFYGLDFRNSWNLENERQRHNVFFAVNLHETSASLLWSNILGLS